MHGYLRHLANFARIVEAGSMKSASDALGIAPSGLTESVKVLENRFGTALLIRHKSGVTPTTEGERVYASASGIVDLLNEAMGPSEAEGLQQTARLSAPTEVANTCLGAALDYLQRAHPNLQLKVFPEDELIDHSRFARDYFIRVAAKFAPTEELRTIWSGKANAILVAGAGVVAPEDADDPAALGALPALVGTARQAPFHYSLKNPQGRLTCERILQISQPAAQLSMAAQGLGVTGCLDICAAPQIRSGALRQVLRDRFSVPLEVRLMTHHRRKMRAHEALAEAMERLVAPA